MKEGYKDSPLGKIPKNWEVVKLLDISIDGINNGVFNDPVKVGSGYKLINVKNMYSGSSICMDQLTYLDLDKNEFLKNKVEFGDIFFTRSSLVKAGIAYSNINLSNDDDITYDGHLMRIRPKQDTVWPMFLAYYFHSGVARRMFIKKGKTSTMTTISQSDIADVPVVIPPLPEQKKIAEILSTVDEKIELINQQITETQALKKGLMQRLLTKGIGHTAFKDSPLGEIPVSWEVNSLQIMGIELIDGDRGSNYPKSKDFSNDGYCLFLSAKNVTKNGFKFNECQFINEDRDKLLRKGKLTRNDFIITTRGSVGHIALYSDSVPFENVRLNSGMVILRDSKNVFNTQFLYQLMKSPVFESQVEFITTGSAQPQLTIKGLKKLKLPIPPEGEQLEIGQILSTISNKLKVLSEKKTHHQELKQGLMQQLLTGKIRVKTHNPATA